ncbi:rapamycin-insensitive companion of mTOR-like [Watersipora subatra]|uniref:rapamycin-insensitive companion of mTOR-like n=1 Tax=Watersipora subatra TaxID=2589382 RepID=UPI00355B47DA
MAFKRQRSNFVNSSRFNHNLERNKRKFSIDEEILVIDTEKDPSSNIQDILVHLARHTSLSKARILAYLNGLVRYYTELSSQSKHFEFRVKDVIYCLRGCTLHKNSVVRAAAFRCLRYFIDTTLKVKMFFELKIDWCLARALDLHLNYDSERTQAIRLCRHLLQLHPEVIQPSIILPFIAFAEDGSKANERTVLIGLELLCELAYSNSSLLARCGGVQVIVQHIIQCHNSSRVNEALLQTLLYLLNTSQTRRWCAPIFGLDQLVAPFTDSLYKHTRDTNESSTDRAEDKIAKSHEQRLLHCEACSQALLTAFHTWPGLVMLSSPHNTALSSLINALQLSSYTTQRILLRLMYDIFLLRMPDQSEDFEAALVSCDPCTEDPSWKLQEGFVAAECLALHKETSSRPNLVDNHLALLLSTFIAYGLMETLCEVVIESDAANSISATILLGELLHMSFLLLPWGDSEQTHFLPSLVAASHSTVYTREQRSQAHKAVEYLDRLHSLKKRGKVASSLHLKLLISFIPETEALSTRNQKYKSMREKLQSHLPQDTEETILQLIRESGVLVEQNALKWRWHMVNSILQCNENTLRKVEDYSLHRFLSKLLHFYNPGSDNGFCTIRLDDPQASLYTSIGLLLCEKILLLNAEESHRHLSSLLVDICHSLTENARLYTADFMRALLRLGVPYFSNWCMELLITQLYDQSKDVAMRSLSVINEACENQTNLRSLINSRPSILHLGSLSSLLVTRYLSIPEGFEYLKSSNYLDDELKRWHETFNVRYTEVVDELLAQSLSSYEKSYDNEVQRRSTARRHVGKSVYVPAHLYGQLIQHNEGAEIVANLPYLSEYFDIVRDECLQEEVDIKQAKAAIWVVGHIGSSVFGLGLLEKQGLLPCLINMAERSHVLTLRGYVTLSALFISDIDEPHVVILRVFAKKLHKLRYTAYYALGLVASTQAGVHRLAEHGWRSVMNHRSEEWPVVSSEMLFSDPDAVREIRSLSGGSSMSHSSGRSDSTDRDGCRYEVDEGARSRASTDELMDKMRKDINQRLYEQTVLASEFEPAVRSGKAHSTSELVKGSKEAGFHRRCSSDSCGTWNLDAPSTPVSEDDKSSSSSAQQVSLKEVTELATPVPGMASVSQSDIPAKPAIRHKPSRSLIEMALDPISMASKARSLSWRSDVRGASSMSDFLPHGSSMASGAELTSMDSAISHTSISPIDTGKASLLTANYTMSLNREKKGKPLKRKTRFSSLQSQLIKQDGLSKSVFVAQRDEIGQATVRAMRRKASTVSTESNTSLSLSSLSSPNSHSRRSPNCSLMVRTLSAQGDLDTLSEVRKFSDLTEPVLSFAVKYMGLALPLDVIDLYELRDREQSDPSTSLLSEDLDPVNKTVEGLQMHSSSNCLKCVSSSSEYAELNGDSSNNDEESMFLDRYVDGKVSEAGHVVGRGLLRKECIKFITTICSSIGVHAAEEGLLRLKEQFPYLFDDLCLYSEVCSILSSYQFHLPARRFIQELFQETSFDQIFKDVLKAIKTDLKEACCDKHQNGIPSMPEAT